jgi:hypothetical protein
MVTVKDLKIGTIIHFFDEQSYHPKPKYSVIVGISDDAFDIATVYFNTGINVSAINSPELVALQYKVEPGSDYKFIKDISYIDCSVLSHRMQTSLLESLNSSSGKVLGYLTANDLRNVIDLILSADSILPHYIKLFKIHR